MNLMLITYQTGKGSHHRVPIVFPPETIKAMRYLTRKYEGMQGLTRTIIMYLQVRKTARAMLAAGIALMAYWSSYLW